MICFAKPHKYQSPPVQNEPQNGAVLIVSLVMLTILTIIAIGTITDTNLQSNMARNNQISLRAFNVALSELKAQFQSSKDNGQIDEMPYQQKLSDIYQTETPHDILQADMLIASPDFTQTGTISFLREGVCGGGNEIGNSALIYEVNSTSRLDNTGINSDQSFGICYPNPNTD
jgi:type II secretory pathway pseudopilin PulG